MPGILYNRKKLITEGYRKFADTNTPCPDPETVYLGQTKSRSMCKNHRDEGYGDRNTR